MIDPITLEVLRCKLEAIAEDGSRTIIRTAISPVVAEGGDCACAIYNAEGELVVGGGAVQLHFDVGTNGIKAIQARHGKTIAPGDIFLVNDPYNGGGLHAQDVFIHVPVFADGKLAAWAGTSAHMIDMGGMVPGSFSTAATEVYQEAFRVPSVRLYRAGVEQEDIWAILRNNVRMANIVEMDMRSLISGANVVMDQLAKIVADYGADVFTRATHELADLTEAEVRRRIGELEPGVYRTASWSEWTNEFYHIPCALTVEKDKLIFDFDGASPQTKHFLNSKTYVIRSMIGVALCPYLAKGLPFNAGIFRAFEVRCVPGSILDAQSPAPIGGPHLDIGANAMEVAMRALNLAIAASPNSRARSNLAGPAASSGMAICTLAGRKHSGEEIGWLVLDGALVAASAGHDRDAGQMTYQIVGSGILEIVDVEVLESWYPIRFERRELRTGADGAGAFNAGRSASLAYAVDGAPELSLTIMGQRERLPIAGTGGGLPGSVTSVRLRRPNSAKEERIACHQEGVVIREGETIIVDACNGGGWGDPLDRDPAAVKAEIHRGLLTADDARRIFGVTADDSAATTADRVAMRQQRLARATAAPKPLSWTPQLRRRAEGMQAPLAVGVEQRGAVAVAARSGAPLALSPDSWVDGCPRIQQFLPSSPDVNVVAYLDPVNGDLLLVDVVAVGVSRSFDVCPERWLRAANQSGDGNAARH
jgi:N-methylhydantoinase B